MDLVLDGQLVESKNRLQLLSDSKNSGLVISVLIPNSNSITHLSSRDHDATNLVVVVESLADHGEYEVLPAVVQVELLSRLNVDDPFATLGVGSIFPQRLDTLFEEVIIGVHFHSGWFHHVIVEAPEIFDGRKGSNGAKIRFVLITLSSDSLGRSVWPSVVPESPLRLERMRSLCWDFDIETTLYSLSVAFRSMRVVLLVFVMGFVVVPFFAATMLLWL